LLTLNNPAVPPGPAMLGDPATINALMHAHNCSIGAMPMDTQLEQPSRAVVVQLLTSVCHVHGLSQCLDIQPAILDEGHRVCICHIRTSQCLVVTPASRQHRAGQDLVQRTTVCVLQPSL
jgi:hypothetical protein